MGEKLLSVGVDVGTTSTQMVVSELVVENRAGSFSVPEMAVSQRKILYKSKVHFTPLKGGQLVDGEAIRELVEREYALAGIRRELVDTGAVIITGETSRKENAREVLAALSAYAGDFVVATAGPELESVLAAKGAGAVAFSGETGQTVLHMDIGGGTSNLALIRDGQIVATGCLNVGGRLLKFQENGKVSYVSPVLDGICDLKMGDAASREQVKKVAEVLTQGLEMAAGLQPRTELLDRLWTEEAGAVWQIPTEECVISFSGGVADCIETEHPWLEFGDMGPLLGQAIRESKLCRDAYRLGQETIRATVIGAGSHATQLSGSTVFYRDVALPLKNLPVVALTQRELASPEAIRQRLRQQDRASVLALPALPGVGYGALRTLASVLTEAVTGQDILVAAETDLAKALGQAMALRTDRPILCIDRVRLRQGDYLDVAPPVGLAFPVVVKTLVLGG